MAVDPILFCSVLTCEQTFLQSCKKHKKGILSISNLKKIDKMKKNNLKSKELCCHEISIKPLLILAC